MPTPSDLPMPSDFPNEPYESTLELIAPLAQVEKEHYLHFAGAWNAVKYRFIAMAEHGEDFTQSILDGGRGPNDRYRQERDLFGFFSNGFSVFEAAFYGLFTVGSILRPDRFPMRTAEEQQSISPSLVRKTFTREFPTDALVVAINELAAQPQYSEWRNIRNVLTHRSAPGRRLYMSNTGETPPDEWNILGLNIPLNASLTATRRAALAGLLGSFLRSIAAFSKERLGK